MSFRSALFAGLCAVAALIPEISHAAEIKVLSANVFTGVLDGLIGDFERSSGHKVTIVYATAGVVKSRVQSGEAGDVAIASKPMLAELERNGKIASGTTADLARSGVALVVRSGAGKPDISTSDAFKHSLLAAHSISYPNPTRGGATGVLVTKILERLNLATDMKSKTKFPPQGHFAVELVAEGEVEFAIAQPMEALLQPGVDIVGLLPTDLQDPPKFTFTAGQMAAAKEPEAARAFINYLVGPAVQLALKSKGMQPAH